MIAAGLKLLKIGTPTDRWAEEWSNILGPDQQQILLEADPWPAGEPTRHGRRTPTRLGPDQAMRKGRCKYT